MAPTRHALLDRSRTILADPTFLSQILSAGVAQCGAAISGNENLMAALFLAGLVGSPTHCVGMCGPFVLSQTVARLEATPVARMSEFRRLEGAALLPYHLGRATTYALLGAVGAAIIGGLIDVELRMRGVSAAMLALAAAFFLLYGLNAVDLAPPPRFTKWWSDRFAPLLRPLFSRPLGWRGYGLGVVLGFLPCGLLYGALAAAASSGSPLAGAMAMAAFAVGTMPALVAVALAGHLAGNRWRARARRAAPVLTLANAVVLSYLAWRMVA